MDYFKKLELQSWRQFDDVKIDFTAQTTVLTGANGCGKTSILTVLSHHFGWNINFVSTPYISRKKKKLLYSEFIKPRRSSNSGRMEEVLPDLDEDIPPDSHPQPVGFIEYSNGQLCSLSSPSKNSSNAQYQLQYSSVLPMEGLYIPSHRPSASYHSVSSIPTNPKTNAQQYQEYQQLLVQMFNGSKTTNPGGVMKQSLIALAVFGYGNQAVVQNSEYSELFESFQMVLLELLPTRLGFRRLEIRMPDVVLVTDSGEFALDAMSGGINALFTIAWQIQMFGWKKEGCTVLIDEPENHLHPSMQRSLLPSLAKAFPNYRFIVSTHSPFIVSSDPLANVFALTHNENKRISSHHLEAADLAASPEKVLREILEVPSTMPIWAEDALTIALQEYQARANDPSAMNELFEKLKTIGLSASVAELPFNGSR